MRATLPYRTLQGATSLGGLQQAQGWPIEWPAWWGGGGVALLKRLLQIPSYVYNRCSRTQHLGVRVFLPSSWCCGTRHRESGGFQDFPTGLSNNVVRSGNIRILFTLNCALIEIFTALFLLGKIATRSYRFCSKEQTRLVANLCEQAFFLHEPKGGGLAGTDHDPVPGDQQRSADQPVCPARLQENSACFFALYMAFYLRGIIATVWSWLKVVKFWIFKIHKYSTSKNNVQEMPDLSWDPLGN